MNILLDTCTFLWICTEDDSLSAPAKAAFKDPENEIFLSAASSWEIAVKFLKKKLPLPEPPERFVQTRRERHSIEALPIEEAAATYVYRLPEYHRDPFDRMLVSQAVVHGMTILTPDPAILLYPVSSLW